MWRNSALARLEDAAGGVEQLPRAPALLCVISVLLYAYIGLQAAARLVSHDPGRQEVLLLCGLYCAETILALVFGVSTMNKWSKSTYVLHHLPFVVVVTPAVTLIGAPAIAAFRLTLRGCLLTCFNESLSAARALGAPRIVDIPRCAFVVVLMACLIPTEAWELSNVLLAADATAGLRVVAAGVSLAVVYHTVDVLPCNVRGCKKALEAVRHGTQQKGKAS